MVEIIFDKEYSGPNIFELISIIPDITDKVIKLRWTNSRDEICALSKFKRNFLLVVPDASVFDRAICTFSKRLKLPPGVLERARLLLIDQKNYDWRRFTSELHDISPSYVLLQLAADSVRHGLSPSLAGIVASVFVDGVSPVDADVLLRLKSGRIRG